VPVLSVAGTSVEPFKSAFSVTVAACAAIDKDAKTSAAKIVRGRRFTSFNLFLLLLVG
jgi:hypothetical protein